MKQKWRKIEEQQQEAEPEDQKKKEIEGLKDNELFVTNKSKNDAFL